MVEAYYTIIPETLTVQDADLLAPKMPLKRYVDYLKLNNDQAKIQNVIAYFLLLKVLKDNDISIKGLDFSFKGIGKPYFKDLYVKFNLSHSKNIVAVAIDSFEVGIDVEKIHDFRVEEIDSVYSTQEQKLYQDKLLDQEFLCKTWTMKESYTKLGGLGLNQNFTTISFDLDDDINQIENLYIHTYKIQDFYMSVSSQRSLCKVKFIDIDELQNL